jgi:non-ribosomal peptide synthetase component E (peptide arylation enzyme)
MDPDASWVVLNDVDWPYDERVRAAEDLATWLLRHGHPPNDQLTHLPIRRDFALGFCAGFKESARTVRALPEIEQLRSDLMHVADRNTQHVVDSSMRLLEALND